ncbi:MAG: Calx-beta domain-containing protein [Chloroflexota bacterium]
MIDDPVQNSVISTTLPVTITGGAYTPDGIDSVTIFVDGVHVNELTMGGVVTDSTWAMPWFPSGPGSYEITAVLTDTLNNPFTDTLNVTLTGYVLSVFKDGSGSGTVNSSSSLTCGTDCMETFAPSSVVTLTAVPDLGTSFNGWAGACSGANDCVVTMNAMQEVTATFALPGIVVQPTNITLTETGIMSETILLSLTSRPTDMVSIDLTSNDLSECTVSPAQVVLNSSNWEIGVTATVTAVDENIDDGDQTCLVETSDISSNDPLYDGMAVDDVTVSVIDDDGTPSINFANTILDVAEAGTAVTLTLSLSNPSSNLIIVDVRSADVTAEVGMDYTVVSETITFPALTTSATFTVPILADNLDEPTETFTVTLSNPSNAELGLNKTANVQIVDDDEPVNLYILDNSIIESDSGQFISFTVHLTAPSAYTVTADYETVAGTATSPTDYTAVNNTIAFPPGVVSQTIAIPIAGDDDHTGHRDFTVQLSNPMWAVIIDSQATGTIYEDDPAYAFFALGVLEYTVAPDLIVDSLTVSGDEIEIVVKNIGNATVTEPFWIDVYIDPEVPPTAVNQTIDTQNSAGAIWLVHGNLLPLYPNQTLTLTLDDEYFMESLSRLDLPLAAGTAVYAQVDSAAIGTTYGAVLESHEVKGEVYNNVLEGVSE